MSDKCSGCGFYTLACQCRKDDNRCGGCGRMISDCTCGSSHTDHWRYDNPYTYKYENDDPCNGGSDHNSGSED